MTSDNAEPDRPSPFPWYVRLLAVLHVLSLVAGPAGFFVFIAVACGQYVRHGWEKTVIEAGLLAFSSPAICALYRRWFEHWGRSRWPDGKYDPR